jgi:hypothetical protein
MSRERCQKRASGPAEAGSRVAVRSSRCARSASRGPSRESVRRGARSTARRERHPGSDGLQRHPSACARASSASARRSPRRPGEWTTRCSQPSAAAPESRSRRRRPGASTRTTTVRSRNRRPMEARAFPSSSSGSISTPTMCCPASSTRRSRTSGAVGSACSPNLAERSWTSRSAVVTRPGTAGRRCQALMEWSGGEGPAAGRCGAAAAPTTPAIGHGATACSRTPRRAVPGWVRRGRTVPGPLPKPILAHLLRRRPPRAAPRARAARRWRCAPVPR